MDDWQSKALARLGSNAYAAETKRRIKAAQCPESQDSPIYLESLREIRKARQAERELQRRRKLVLRCSICGLTFEEGCKGHAQTK